MSLYREEIQQAPVKLKWRGERLTDDTLYAIALTGLSWETCWGKDPLFSLCWGDLSKVRQKRGAGEYDRLRNAVVSSHHAQDHVRAVALAEEHFRPEEIQCDPMLKQAVGSSWMQIGQPARALQVFAAPFDMKSPGAAKVDRRFRQEAFEAARRAGQTQKAIAFALSLVLEPGMDPPVPDPAAMAFLQEKGVDLDRVLLGILQAPERLRGLPQYIYPAADLLALRATPRLLPFFMHLAQSNDVHLRSRAIFALGVLAYQARPGDPPGWYAGLLPFSPREYGLSAGERRLILREVMEAARSDRYRLRAAAAIAAALIGDEDAVPLLQKLVRDRAYLMAKPADERSGNVKIYFPVRMAACTGLARFGIVTHPGGGELSGKALQNARRGGSDVTGDTRGLRKDARQSLVVLPQEAFIATAMLRE